MIFLTSPWTKHHHLARAASREPPLSANIGNPFSDLLIKREHEVKKPLSASQYFSPVANLAYARERGK